MKRHNNLYQQMTSPENIRAAWLDARRGKSSKSAVRRFERDLDANLERIRQSLINKTYKTSPYKTMIIKEPKERLIYRLPYDPDRIIHHVLMRVVEPIWQGMFISDSYACIKGRGIHEGSKRAMEYVRRNRYCLKMDISKFYPSVDHDILYKIIQRKIKCVDTLQLFREIIYSVPNGKNVPIGNYTSQWMGNLYLNELDYFVKHTLRVKDYVRYCDDFCLFSDDKKHLGRLASEIETFLATKLALKLSKNSIFPVTQGVDFLGYRHFPTHVLLRKSTTTRIRRRLRSLPKALATGLVTFEYFRSCIASIKGWMRWANTHHLRLATEMDALERIIKNGGIAAAKTI